MAAIEIEEFDRRIELRSSTPTCLLHQLTSWALERGVELIDLSVSRPSLEDVYLQLTGAGDE
ncbi:MAG: hypothetical protein ACRDVD_03405 [Acidimicrobiia bacterium]